MVGFTETQFLEVIGVKMDYSEKEEFIEYINDVYPNISKEILECYCISFGCDKWEDAKQLIEETFPQEVVQQEKEIPKTIDIPVSLLTNVVILDAIHVECHCFNSYKLQEELKKIENVKFGFGLISKYIKKKLQDEEVRIDGTLQKYSLIEPTISSDAFGLYKYDPFYGKLKIIIQMDKSASKPLPQRFRASTKCEISLSFILNEGDKSKFQPIVNNSLQGFVHYILHQSSKPLHHAESWLECLQDCGIDSINELKDWQKYHWDKCKLPIEAQRIMFRDIQTYCDLVQEQNLKGNIDKQNEKVELAKEYAIIHNIIRFFQHNVGDYNKERGFLNKLAVKEAFIAMQQMNNIPTGVILEELERAMEELCFVNRSNHLKSPFLGILLYGPPGTGKTQLCIKLCDLCGLTPVNSPIASTDTNRPHVGETEEALRAIFQRAKLMPHILHCLAIDEIDGLTQKRSQKVSEHAISTMSELLALVGGIKALPNLLLIGSTNRPHMMDDAMLRRLPRKFFVGRPAANLRKKAFKRLPTEYLEPNVIDTLLLITTNYHGAALQSVCSQIEYFLNKLISNNQLRMLTKQDIIDIVSRVSRSYEMQIGPFIVADILQTNPQILNITQIIKNNPISDYTGRIIVDMSSSEASIQFETFKRDVINIQFEGEIFPFASQLVPTFVQFALERDLEMIQYIDSEVLTSNAAFDDQSIQELLQEFLMETKGYQKSLLVIDMDSLLGVSCSQSYSSMGLSTSYSFSKPNLAAWLFGTGKSAMQIGPRGIERWIVIVIGTSFSLEACKEMIRFPKTNKEKEDIKIQEEEATIPIKCITCGNYFLRSENNPLDCGYHKGELNEKNVYNCCGEEMSKSHGNNVSGCIRQPHIPE